MSLPPLAPHASRPSRWRPLIYAVLAAWLVVTVALGAILLARHELAMPVPPKTDPVLAAAVVARADAEAWTAIHVLYPVCPCARRIVARLKARTLVPGVRERVVLVAATPDPTLAGDLAARGFVVEHVLPAELGRGWHIEATPLLIVAAPGGEPRYVGGYARRKQGPAVEDTEIIAAMRAAASHQTLPVFGCATSRRLARAVDPLDLASWR